MRTKNVSQVGVRVCVCAEVCGVWLHECIGVGAAIADINFHEKPGL